tara:strand:- start:772 stop:1374 length:603 start_codon:yes stop_codon:yes gene_type:complete
MRLTICSNHCALAVAVAVVAVVAVAVVTVAVVTIAAAIAAAVAVAVVAAVAVVVLLSIPSGASLTEARKKEIYAIASEFNLIILEDDPYYWMQFVDQGQERTKSFMVRHCPSSPQQQSNTAVCCSTQLTSFPSPLFEILTEHGCGRSRASVRFVFQIVEQWFAGRFCHWTTGAHSTNRVSCASVRVAFFRNITSIGIGTV